jgi:hypothetical protein
MRDDRELADSDGRVWRLTQRSPAGDRVLRFQSGRDVRIAPYRDGWDELPDERLRKILETEATSDEEGLHGLSDALGG